MNRFNKLLFIAILVVVIAVPLIRAKLKAQVYIAELASGVVLEATSRNRGALFKNSKVLLIDYLPKGATGVVLTESISDGIARYQNEKLNLAIRERSNQLEDMLPRNGESGGALYWGGPVAQTHLFNVSYQPISGALQMTGHQTHLANRDEAAIVASFAGFAGWGENQLQAEVRKGDWRVYRADSNKIIHWLTVNDSRSNSGSIEDKHAEQ